MDVSSNLAYDFKHSQEQKKPQISDIKMIVKPKKQHILSKAICFMSVVVIMLSALIYTKVVQSELSSDYNVAVKELNTLKGENSRLQIKSEKQFSPDTIEHIAKETLKMQQIDNSKIEYIQFNNKDSAQVIKKQTFFDTFKGWFSGLFN